MLVRVKKHPTLGILVASNGMIFNRVGHSKTGYKWTFGCVTSRRYATVSVDGKHYQVHRLVAETFLPNTEGKPQVDHILRDTLDNNVCQIRWATPSENSRNRVNNTGLTELLDADMNMYMNMYMKVWYRLNTEKCREQAKRRYRRKREAGFHYVNGADGKRHWEKI